MKSFKAQISPIAYLLGHPLELKQICKVRDRKRKKRFLFIRLSVISPLSGIFLSTSFIMKAAFQKWAITWFYTKSSFSHFLKPGPGTVEKHQAKRHRLRAESYLPFILEIIKLLIGNKTTDLAHCLCFKIKCQTKNRVICNKLDVVPMRASEITEAVASNKQINLWIISIKVNRD